MFDLPEAPQQRRYGETLHEHREGHYGKGDHYNVILTRQSFRKRQGECERQCTPKPAPKKYVLIPKIHLEAALSENGT